MLASCMVVAWGLLCLEEGSDGQYRDGKLHSDGGESLVDPESEEVLLAGHHVGGVLEVVAEAGATDDLVTEGCGGLVALESGVSEELGAAEHGD